MRLRLSLELIAVWDLEPVAVQQPREDHLTLLLSARAEIAASLVSAANRHRCAWHHARSVLYIVRDRQRCVRAGADALLTRCATENTSQSSNANHEIGTSTRGCQLTINIRRRHERRG